MKQSSIEWLFEELNKLEIKYIEYKGKISKNVYNTTKFYYQEKAKEMHKQEVIDASIDFMNTDGIPNKKDLAEQYYNETFKTESNGK
jgi:hypothetical protein